MGLKFMASFISTFLSDSLDGCKLSPRTTLCSYFSGPVDHRLYMYVVNI